MISWGMLLFREQHCLCTMFAIKNVQLKTLNYSAIGIYLLIL
jgi:hypothetical protein